MTRVLLIHGGTIPHYRVPIYGHLSRYLHRYRFDFRVASTAIQARNPHPVEFHYSETPLSATSIARLISRQKIDVVVMFVGMRDLYLFPTYLVAKGLLGRRMVWWGQGRDLADRDAWLKNAAYTTEHALCDAIILYADHLKKYVTPRFHRKVFVANNTLVLTYAGLPPDAEQAKRQVLAAYGIDTTKNIICVGRFQRRKRLDRLAAALRHMNRSDIGLILVGPDTEHVLDEIQGDHVYKLGPIYGDERLDLMSAADVYCLPGAVGLSIVDAFHCGLPFVTEEGDESAEMMYLKHGTNGFIVPAGNIAALSEKLLLLLDDVSLRRRFSEAARQEIAENGSIERLCAGFRDSLEYATRQRRRSL